MNDQGFTKSYVKNNASTIIPINSNPNPSHILTLYFITSLMNREKL